MKRYRKKNHCAKRVRVRSYSGPYSVQMWENTDENNSEYGNVSVSNLSLIFVSLERDVLLKLRLKYVLRDSVYLQTELH